VRLILQKGGAHALLVVSRLAQSTEQRDNAKFMQGVSPPGVLVKHVALLGKDEFAVAVAQQVDVFHGTSIIVLRGTVADKFNLRDWISFLAVLPLGKAIVLLTRASGTAGLTLSDYIASARLPRRPELTWDT
jgi:hypothetical protein